MAGIGAFGAIADGMLGFMQQSMQNWYNSPANQMQMMIDAGINPNLAAAGIAGSPSNNTSFSRPTDLAGGALGDVNAEIQSMMQRSQEKVNDSIADRNEAEAESIRINSGITKDSSAAIVAKNFADASVAEANYNLTNTEYERLKPYAEHAAEWYKIDFDKLDQTVKNLKAEHDKLEQEYKNLKKEYDRLVSEIGENQAKARLENAEAALKEQEKQVRDQLGGTDDLQTAYVLAGVNGDEKTQKEIENGVKKVTQASEEGKLEANYGHQGIIGQAVDAIRLFSGKDKGFGVADLFRSFGIYIDSNGYPQFKPIADLFSRFGRPSYSEWESMSKNNLRKYRTEIMNAYQRGDISKEDYQKGCELYDSMMENINKETYDQVNGSYNFKDLQTNPIR